MSDTPETDAFAIKFKTLCGEKYWVPVDIARKLERERDEARELLASEKITRNHIIKRSVEVERERDEAREKVEQQRKEIVRLNGATNHAGGTPLKIALRERDEARNKMADALQEVDLRTLDFERMKKERQAFVIAQQEVITNLILEHNKALDKINDLKNILR